MTDQTKIQADAAAEAPAEGSVETTTGSTPATPLTPAERLSTEAVNPTTPQVSAAVLRLLKSPICVVAFPTARNPTLSL